MAEVLENAFQGRSAVQGARRPRWSGGSLPSVSDLRRTRLAFVGLCCYLIAQAAYIPVLAVGPSWAIWPTPPDLAVIALGTGFLLNHRGLKIASRSNAWVLQGLVLISLGFIGMFFVCGPLQKILGLPGDSGFISYGVYPIYRMLQFLLVFRVAAGMPLSPRRVKALSVIASAVLVFVALSVFATFTSILDTRRLMGNLPTNPLVAGAWSVLADQQRYGCGTIGYDHAYTALQLIMLLALRASLTQRRRVVTDTAFLLMTIAAVFLTGSRSGLAAMLVYSVAFFIQRPGSLLIAIGICCLSMFLLGRVMRSSFPDMGENIERGLTLANPLASDNLSGRQDIWHETLDLLGNNPMSWITGRGPGYVTQFGRTAHNMYLHTLVELGVVGLLVLLTFMSRLVGLLRRYESGTKPILVATIAFLITSLTQETFYPVTFLGHFLGLYLLSLAIALNPRLTAGLSVQPMLGRTSA
jgi:hypothetical protein